MSVLSSDSLRSLFLSLLKKESLQFGPSLKLKTPSSTWFSSLFLFQGTSALLTGHVCRVVAALLFLTNCVSVCPSFCVGLLGCFSCVFNVLQQSQNTLNFGECVGREKKQILFLFPIDIEIQISTFVQD